MQFRFNPISQPIDTIPENPSEAKPPVTYDYFHASISMGDKLNTQVKTIVEFSNDKIFERFEEFLIPKEDLELFKVTDDVQEIFTIVCKECEKLVLDVKK